MNSECYFLLCDAYFVCCVRVIVGWSCWLRKCKISSFRIKMFAAVGSSQHEKVPCVGHLKQNHKGEGLHIPTVVWVGFYVTQKERMYPSHLCSCAVTVSTLSPAGWILLLQSLWEANHIFTCGQLTRWSYPHAYVTANLPFTCSEPHSSMCTEESSRLLSVSVAAVRSSSPCVAVALLLFAANPTQT